MNKTIAIGRYTSGKKLVKNYICIGSNITPLLPCAKRGLEN